MLKGKQHKLDKNKDGKISGEDFKMMGKKRGGSTPGLKDYVKKSDSQEKMIKVIENGITKFVKKSKVMDNPSKYTPAPSSISREKRKRDLIKKQNPISEYDKKGKLTYTGANKGSMMNKSTRGYGAARTSGMGLQDESVRPGKVMKAAKGKMTGRPSLDSSRLTRADIKSAMERLKNLKQTKPGKGGGADASKRMSDAGKKRLKKYIDRLKTMASPGSKIADIIRKKMGEEQDRKRGPKPRTMTPLKKMGSDMINRFNKGSIARVPGGYSKEGSGRISDKALKGNSPSKLFSEKEKKMENTKTSGMRKKMAGGMMQKPMGYKKGTSVMARGCKLGRKKPTRIM